MKFKKQRDEEERLERAAKIKAHLNREGKATAPTYRDDAPLDWSQEKPAATAKEEPQYPATAPTRIYPALQPWEKIGAFGRREQFRPMTRAEQEAVQESIFLKKQYDADQAYREKVRQAEDEAKAELKATLKRVEHEARTGMRPWEPGRYCSIEEARSRGYLGSGSAEEGEQ